MYYGSKKEMERMDVLAVRYGLEIQQMMELAGFHMVEVFRLLRIQGKKKIVIVVGKGNKGGDGLCAARHLVNRGWNVTIVLISQQMSSDAAHQLVLLKKMGAPIVMYTRQKRKAMNLIGKADYLIDSLIGYHLRGAPRGDFKFLIELMNAVPAKIIAYDLPSGLDATTGECLEPTIRAYTTLSLALPKRAFQKKAGKTVSGKVFVGDIGIPRFIYEKVKKNSMPKFSKTHDGLLAV